MSKVGIGYTLKISPLIRGGYLVTCRDIPDICFEAKSPEEAIQEFHNELAALIPAYSAKQRVFPMNLHNTVALNHRHVPLRQTELELLKANAEACMPKYFNATPQ